MSGGRAPGLVRQRASSTARSTADSGVQWSVPWDDDAEVQFLVFSLAEGRWIFRHVYRERGDGRRVLTYNEVKLVVDYADGIVSGIELTMHVVFPERLGRVSYLGVDVSPGAKTFLEFSYEPEPTAVASTTGSGVGRGRVVDPAAGATAYRLSRISAGVSRSAEVRPGASDVDSPFPVLARVVPEYGAYSVPYARSVTIRGPVEPTSAACGSAVSLGVGAEPGSAGRDLTVSSVRGEPVEVDGEPSGGVVHVRHVGDVDPRSGWFVPADEVRPAIVRPRGEFRFPASIRRSPR